MSVCILSEIKVTRNPTVSLHFPYTFYNEEYYQQEMQVIFFSLFALHIGIQSVC